METTGKRKIFVDYIDYKTTIWQRIKVEAELSEEELQELKGLMGQQPAPSEAFEFSDKISPTVENEVLYGTDSPVCPNQDGNDETVIFYCADHKVIWDNSTAGGQ